MTVIPPPGCPAGGEATEAFAGHRDLLFAVAYGMLGSVGDTEDILARTWQSWTRGAASGGGPRRRLVEIAVRHALARRSALRRRRCAYVGPWLPEPLVSPADGAADAPVSLALLVVLEDLPDLERAVFVLSEIAGCDRAEIAEMVGRSPAAVRHAARQATAQVQARRPRHQADPRVRQGITARFAAAMLGADREAFARLLAPQVAIWTDSGGQAPGAALCGAYRRDRAAQLLAAGSYRPRAEPGVRCRRVNGDLSLVVTAAGRPYAVLVLDLDPEGGQVCGIYAVTNPDKLARAG
ncbi:MAG TPA: sigma factor-like helix-turn-helix DNA-binding protein [Streptosporangiaceae bacterium]|jgi:RNA polymerase sigma-70 factor (ECF subfamily)